MEIRAIAGSGHDTALVTLARCGFLRLLAAPHVFAEVNRYLDRWARETGTPITAYRTRGPHSSGLSSTRCRFHTDLLTPDELARIGQLDRPQPLGDPDDVPTAIAAMVLAAPLLSGDHTLLAAVYGPTVDMEKQDAYLDALFGGGRVFVLSQMGTATPSAGPPSRRPRPRRHPNSRSQDRSPAFGCRCGCRRQLGSFHRAGPHFAVANARPAAHDRPVGFVEILAIYAKAEADYNRFEPPLIHDIDVLALPVRAVRDATREKTLRQSDRRAGRRLDRWLTNRARLSEVRDPCPDTCRGKSRTKRPRCALTRTWPAVLTKCSRW